MDYPVTRIIVNGLVSFSARGASTVSPVPGLQDYCAYRATADGSIPYSISVDFGHYHFQVGWIRRRPKITKYGVVLAVSCPRDDESLAQDSSAKYGVRGKKMEWRQNLAPRNGYPW